MSNRPPSTIKVALVMNRASSDARKQIAASTSSDLPMEPRTFSTPLFTQLLHFVEIRSPLLVMAALFQLIDSHTTTFDGRIAVFDAGCEQYPNFPSISNWMLGGRFQVAVSPKVIHTRGAIESIGHAH